MLIYYISSITSLKFYIHLLILCFLSINTFTFAQWAVNVGSTDTDHVSKIAVDGSGNVYVIGYFKGTADLDPGAGSTSLVSAGQYDIFFAKYNSAGNFLWAKRLGGISYDYGRSITIDSGGNILITGDYRSTVDFDPGDGTTNLSSDGASDVFFAKYNSDGEFIWAKSVGGSGYDYGQGIVLDNSGNVYISGYFRSGTADFDPGVGTTNLTCAGDSDIFFAKYNSSGGLIWAKKIGNNLTDETYSFAVDGNGNISITGYFSGTVDFDPDAGTSNLTSTNNNEVFFAKYNLNGNLVWVKSLVGTSKIFEYSIAIDESGNVYITGTFNGTVDFDPGAGTLILTSTGGYDIYLAKYNSAGEVIWAKNMGGTSGDYANNLTIDGSGNIYVTGYFSGTSDFDPGAGITSLISAGSTDVFFAKYNSSGDIIWAKKIGSTSGDNGNSIAVDGNGNVYVAGEFTGTVDFDPGLGTTNLTNESGGDIFIAKYNSNGIISSISISSPLGGESWDQNSSHNITWHSTGSTAVKIEFSPDGGASWSTVVSSITASAGSYYWTVPATATINAVVKVTDLSNASVLSSSSYFTITLNAPELLSPLSGSLDNSTTPTLVWSKIPGVTRYNVLMSTNYYFTTIVLQKQLSDTSYQLTAQLNENTKYYWKASAVNSQGNAGEYSAPFNFTTGSTELPVELISFSANVNEDKVELYWSTATELNNYGFEVERASTSLSTTINATPSVTGGWIKLGFVPGAGNSNSPKQYSITDQPSGGKSFSYRLKQIDVNGHYRYYDAVTAELDQLAKAELMQNSPNPFNPSTSIKFYIPGNSGVSIIIYDMLGREVALLLNKETSAGYHMVYWNGRNNYGETVASGVYLYRLNTGKFSETKKMLLMK